MTDTSPSSSSSSHVETAVQAIAKVHEEHHRAASALQRIADKATARAGQPATLLALLIVVLVWSLANTLIQVTAGWSPDPPPFFWLQGLLGLGAIFMTVLILITQRRERQIGESREQLTLQLAILSEQKITKVIQLLEEIRRDTPFLPNRLDEEADALATSADPQEVLEIIREAHAAMLETVDGEALQVGAEAKSDVQTNLSPTP